VCVCVFLQLGKLRNTSKPAPASAEKEPSNEDVALLQQRVSELEQILSESKTNRNIAASGEETGVFLYFCCKYFLYF